MSDSLTDGTTDVDKPETTANSDNNEKESLSTNENKTGEQSEKEKEQIATEFEDNGKEDAGTETALSSENSEKEILSTNENKITEQPEKERTPPQTEEKTSQDVANTDVKRKEEENIHGNTQDENETVQAIDNMVSVTEEITVKLTEKETTPDISRVETIDNTEKETTPDISKVERISPQPIDNTEKETTPDISKVERITPQTIDNTEDVTGNNEEELGKSQHVESATGKTLVKITEGEIIPNEYEHVTQQHVDKVESVTDNKVTNITEDETILDNPKNAIKTSQNIDNIESVTEKLNVKTSNEDTTTADNIKDEKRTPQNIDNAESVTEKTDAKTKEEETIQEKVLPLTTENQDIFVEKVRLESNKAEEEEQDTAKISQSIKNKEESSPPKQSSEPGTLSITAKDETSVEKQSAKTPESSSTAPSKDEHADHVTYTEDGSAIYTDPQTKYQYKWCTKSNNWTPIVEQTASSASSSNPYENEHYKWCQETQKWIPKQAQVTETEHYKWDAEKQQWIPKKNDADKTQTTDNVYGIDEDGQRIYTDKDGTVFFWDVEKSAWFPKLDDDFMARYQMSYGFIDNTSAAENEKKKLEQEEAELKEKELQKMTEEAKSNDEASQGAGGAAKRKATQEPPKWFEIDPDRNTKVYVSNLPLDITLDEFTEVMGKCGMIMRDPLTQKFKLKLYTEADGQIKGDGLCDYIKVESVDLALKILDEYELRGHKIRVQQAQFQMRGEYNPALKPKRKKKDKEKLAKIKEKLFDWRPEKMRGERSKHEKTVIIKNLFHPELFEKEVQLILDYQNDLKEECNKCGTVRKVVIYDRHAEGVAQINMASPEEADLVIQMMQGRFFGKRQLTAEHWDGKTKYKIEETEEEVKKRLNKWDKYLETDAQKSEVKRVDQEKADSDDCEKGTTDEVCEQSEEPVVADIAT